MILQFLKSVNRSETLNLANNILTMSARALIFHMSIFLVISLFRRYKHFDHVTLTLEFDLPVLFEKIK